MEPCTVHQAGLYAVQKFLQAQFDGDERFPRNLKDQRCFVTGEWPADNLKPRCVSILPAGERQDFRYAFDDVVRQTNLPDNQGLYTWAIKAFRQNIQLDIWAQTDAERGLIEDALDRFLNLGTKYTLGPGLGRSVHRDGLLLELDPKSGHQGKVDFTFEAPRAINDGEAIRQSEFRSLIRGFFEGELTFTAKTARLAVVKLKGSLSGSPYQTTLQADGSATAQL